MPTKRRDAIDQLRNTTDAILQAIPTSDRPEFETCCQDIFGDDRITGNSMMSIGALLRMAFDAGKRAAFTHIASGMNERPSEG